MVKVLGLILAALAVEMILGAGSELLREMPGPASCCEVRSLPPPPDWANAFRPSGRIPERSGAQLSWVFSTLPAALRGKGSSRISQALGTL